MAGHSDTDAEEISDINVTPFIDVILVLLIIFMVAAPLATVDLPVDLPSANAARQDKPEKPIYVTVSSDLTLAVGEQPVRRSELGNSIEALTTGDKTRRIFLRADRSVPYGEMLAVLELLRGAGYSKIALVALDASGVK